MACPCQGFRPLLAFSTPLGDVSVVDSTPFELVGFSKEDFTCGVVMQAPLRAASWVLPASADFARMAPAARQRGSSTSTGGWSVGNGVMDISVTPVADSKRCHTPFGTITIVPAHSSSA